MLGGIGIGDQEQSQVISAGPAAAADDLGDCALQAGHLPPVRPDTVGDPGFGSAGSRPGDDIALGHEVRGAVHVVSVDLKVGVIPGGVPDFYPDLSRGDTGSPLQVDVLESDPAALVNSIIRIGIGRGIDSQIGGVKSSVPVLEGVIV